MDTIFPISDLPDVFTTTRAVGLTTSFFACSEAKTLLNSSRFIKPLFIDIDLEFKGGRTQVDYDENGKPFAQIGISNRLGRVSALKLLAIEIFNAHYSYLHPNLEMKNMDTYARRIEEIEYENTKPHFALIKQCGKTWRLSKKELEQYERAELAHSQPEFHFFHQEIACHTDYYRRQWIDDYQKIYCEKHPEDSRSCEAKKDDFCDLEVFRSLPIFEQDKIEMEKTCKAFPEAHATVKTHPDILASILENCPEVLGKEYCE
jgi:hypothetical protein